MAGWNNVIQQLGGQVPASWRNNGQSRRQDVRDWRQQQNRRATTTPTPQVPFTRVTPGTPDVNPDARDWGVGTYQNFVNNVGGSPLSYYDYAMANNGGSLPTAINGTRTQAAPGVTQLTDPVTSDQAFTRGQSFGAPTVVQEYGTDQPVVVQQNNRNRRNRR